MRTKYFTKMHITAAFFCAGLLLVFSCKNQPDEETIRLYIRASDAYSMGHFSEAAAMLQEQKSFYPALILRGKAEFFLGELDKAEKTCRSAVKLRPSSLEAGLYLARILRQKGDLESAINTTENLLSDNPQDIRVLRLASGLALESGKTDTALSLLDRAAECSAECAMVLLDRGRLRWIAGKTNEALEDLSRAGVMLPWDTPLKRSILNLENIIREAVE